MKRTHYAGAFFAGMLLSNAVPHFIHGISGDPFPTPFADPPGKGLSSPTVNIGWAFANIVAGYGLFQRANVGRRLGSASAFLAGAATTGIVLSVFFTKKEKESKVLRAA
jgi:hypothetical protein